MFVKALLAAVGAAAILYPGMAARADQYPDDLVAQTMLSQAMTEGGGECYPTFSGDAARANRTEYSPGSPVDDGGSEDILRTSFSRYGG